MEKKYKVGGMACGGCAASVERALKLLPGVVAVKVDLSAGIAAVTGEVSDDDVAAAIENTGFDFLGIED